MSDGPNLCWQDLHQLFSVILCIDESMAVTYASGTPLKYMPELATRPRLAEVFDVRRPPSLGSFYEARASLHSLCLLTAKSGRFAIRGQLVPMRDDNRDLLCFCGAPWLFWINTNSPETRLGLEDYSSQDVQLDQLFFMNTEMRMISELEQMNTELRAAKENLEEASISQRRFFAQMSHEMRTPLNGVVSALTLMEERPMDARQSQLLTMARSSSVNLMEVINYVLDVSKLELGTFDQEEESFNCQVLLQSVVDTVRARAVEKSLELRLELPADMPVKFQGYPQMLRQTLLNLLINAIKFTEAGHVTLRCLPLSSDDGVWRLRFEVEDSGIGIPADRQSQIFEPFWTSASYLGGDAQPGTGLGLDIVRRNVEFMGGAIALRSSPGEGSTFWFELPLTPVETVSAVEATVSAPQPEVMLSGHILLVDDNETNLMLGSMILSSLGATVTTAPGGAEAVAAVERDRFDLVLMDLSMPEVDGLEATRRIRAFSDHQALPIVALTAHADTNEKKLCLAAGMNDYLTKPIDKDLLAQKLVQWLAVDRTAGGDPEGGVTAAADAHEVSCEGLVDNAVLEELVRQIGRDNLMAVLSKVQDEAALRWQELVAAEEAADAEALQRHAHSLASIFRSVGLMRIGDALKEIENTLRVGDRPEPGWIQALEPLKSASLCVLGQHGPGP